MNNRWKTFPFSLFAAMWFLSFVLVTSSFAQKKGFDIDTAASCVTSSCHSEIAKKKHVHEAAMDGGTCTEVCHQPSAKNRHAFSPLPSNLSDLCFQCHDGGKFQGKTMHGPVATGKCTACQNPPSGRGSLLRCLPSAAPLGDPAVADGDLSGGVLRLLLGQHLRIVLYMPFLRCLRQAEDAFGHGVPERQPEPPLPPREPGEGEEVHRLPHPPWLPAENTRPGSVR